MLESLITLTKFQVLKGTEYYKLRYNSSHNINSIVINFSSNINNLWKENALSILLMLSRNNNICYELLSNAQNDIADLSTLLDKSKRTTNKIYNLIAFNINAGYLFKLNNINEIEGKSALSLKLIKTSVRELLTKTENNDYKEYKRSKTKSKSVMNKRQAIEKNELY